MSFLMTDPGTDPQERVIAVDPLNPGAGSFTVIFQPIPVGKYRSLVKDLEDKRSFLARVAELVAQPLVLDGVSDFDELEALTVKRENQVKARERAEEALQVALKGLVSWGVVGFSDVVKPDLTPYPPAEPKPVKWAGYEYLNLDSKSLYLFSRLGLLWQLAFCILAFNNGELPETLEGFYKTDPK
jgi:hypothetical protein